MKHIILISLLLTTMNSFAQTDSVPPKLIFSGYVEAYYTYDFGNPENHNRPGFIYAFNRHNEINLDLGYIKAAYESKNVRANLALATGTYMNANYAAEPGILKNIYEADAGVKISNKKNLWIDAGIMPSHIGFESAVSKDCWTLTRTILADNSPYFETGAKISYTTDNGKWFLSVLILNGWQRIQRVDGNNTPAFGHQLTFKPNSKVTLNSSSFIGNDKSDSVKQMRYFHNFYGIFQITNNFAITTGFDIGAEQKVKGSSSYNSWYAPVLIFKISPNAKNSIALRGEYYDDKAGVIIGSGTPNGFKTWGYSINYDYIIRDNAMWRIEARGFSSKDKVFSKDGNPTNNNFFITTSLSVSF
ncbi:MAG: porin [Bacteroidota bacterium]